MYNGKNKKEPEHSLESLTIIIPPQPSEPTEDEYHIDIHADNPCTPTTLDP